MPDGRHILLVSSDNDFLLDQDNKIFAFAIQPSALPNFQRQILKPAIDIKPGNEQNLVNLKSKGVFSVAILSGGLFDATAVDPASVRLAGVSAGIKGNGKPQCGVEDVDGDGFTDLLCHFEVSALELNAGDQSVRIEAETYSGTPIVGEGSIQLCARN